MSTRQNSFFPDGGYGWLVVFAATWCNGSIFAIQNSFSILHVMLVNANQQTNESVSQFQIAWIGALSMGMVFLCSPLVSMSTDRFGCRATAVGGSLVAFVGLLTGSFAKSLPLQYLTYGLLFGAGCSYSLQPTLVILGQYFQRHLGLANGLVTAGSSLFSVALPVLLEEVLVPLGLERTFQILSVLPLTQAALLGATFRPPPTPECHGDVQSNTNQTERSNQHCHNNRLEENTFSGIRIFCVPSYRMWAFGVAIAVLGYFVPYVHLMSFVQEQFEDSEQKEWILLVCIGASSGVGRLVFGHVGDLLPGLNKIYLQAVSFMFLGLASILVPQCLTFEGLVVVCVLLGVCDGCLLTLMAPVAFEVLGVQRASQGIGYLLGLMALPMTAGPPLAGLLHDQLGNYCLAFYLAGVPPLIGGLLLLFIPRMHHHLWASRAEMLPGLRTAEIEIIPAGGLDRNNQPSFTLKIVTEQKHASELIQMLTGNANLTELTASVVTAEVDNDDDDDDDDDDDTSEYSTATS
ncbi:monocarboxylate transporter 8 [Electrophorus electricus]|uniref:monocarboxylate transporter 8 n=1 Tax=Electrophorus electricus TaxID=8005 RepID=UPI0015CFDB7B|nr:monocarboxylate transporter 8 [Electrophorus electricus]